MDLRANLWTHSVLDTDFMIWSLHKLIRTFGPSPLGSPSIETLDVLSVNGLFLFCFLPLFLCFIFENWKTASTGFSSNGAWLMGN